jgi:S-adenosylmethionine:tRNA ribosyltransferase-isomerase
MRRDEFRYHLPPELIAQQPLAARSASRLLALDGADGSIRDLPFTALPSLLRRGDLLIFNDTRVVNARLFAQKATGGRVELLLERRLDERCALFQARASKALRAGGELALKGGGSAQVVARHDDLFEIRFDQPVLAYLAAHGDVPLRPYIARAATREDADRYQTLFARVDGAVAAPTAGLHFDAVMLAALEDADVDRASITLHVGTGTFQPVRVDDLDAHRMHPEELDVGVETCRAIAATRAAGGRIVAVGTTVVRALESAFSEGEVRPFRGETRLFVRPGYRFRAVDALLTNFHLPESTLLMLVCAFGGLRHVLGAYAHAVRERYRFFSYGDAMFVLPEPRALERAA